MSALIDDNDVTLTDFQLEAMEELRQIINNEYPQINFQQDDNYLTKYLFANDWNAQECAKKMAYTYRLKRDHPKYFAMKKVSEYLPALNANSRFMLPDRDKHGRRVLLYKTENLSSPELSLMISSQLDDMWCYAMMMDRATQKNGITVIFDFKNMPKSIIKWLVPKQIKLSSEKANIFPCKNLQVHLVHINSILDVMLKVISPLLNDRIKSTIHFHKDDLTQLHNFVGTECLPEEYGGPPGKTIDCSKSYQFLLDRESILEENRTKFGFKNMDEVESR